MGLGSVGFAALLYTNLTIWLSLADNERCTLSGTTFITPRTGKSATTGLRVAPRPGPVPEPAAGTRPHIVMFLVDDWGWADSGWHQHPEDSNREIVTPNLDTIVAEGIELVGSGQAPRFRHKWHSSLYSLTTKVASRWHFHGSTSLMSVLAPL